MTLVLDVPDEAAMAALGADLARILAPGDRVGLVGDLGAGKTTLARAALRWLTADPGLEVASPTFMIVQDYPTVPPVRHVDLYRIRDGAEVDELGLGEGDAIELIEWPRTPLPITVSIDFAGDGRTVAIDGPPATLAALARVRTLPAFLAAAGWGEATRAPLKGDASVRRYERLAKGDARAVLMDAPAYVPAPDSYSARARRADGNPAAFLAVGGFLADAGLSVPTVLAADPSGILLMEDLGDEKVAEGGVPVASRYLAATEALAVLHHRPPPTHLAVPNGFAPHAPPLFDADLAVVELAQFPRWVLGQEPSAEYEALWCAAIDALPRDDDRLALRDVHSPNLMWLPERTGVARVGFIDYQDAMIAPAAFDVVSLGQDARLDIPGELEAAIVETYLSARPNVDRATFQTAYAIIGAQRAARIVGAFHRLAGEGKRQYLAHVPRTRRRLARNLAADPLLEPLANWFERHSDVMGAA